MVGGLSLGTRLLGAVACDLGGFLGRGERLFSLREFGDVSADREKAAALHWFEIELDVPTTCRVPLVTIASRFEHQCSPLLNDAVDIFGGTEIAALGLEP